MEALVLVGGTLLVWTVGFWAVGQLDRFFKEKNAPCRREREGQTRQKKKSSVPERGKSGGTEVKQGEGPRLCFYIVWAPPYSKQVYDRRNKKVWPCCIDFPRKMGRGRSSGFNSHCPRC